MFRWLMAKKKTDKPKPKPSAVPPLWATSLADRMNEIIERLDRIEGECVRQNNIENVNGQELAELREEINLRFDNLSATVKESREWRGHMVLQEYTPT